MKKAYFYYFFLFFRETEKRTFVTFFLYKSLLCVLCINTYAYVYYTGIKGHSMHVPFYSDKEAFVFVVWCLRNSPKSS